MKASVSGQILYSSTLGVMLAAGSFAGIAEARAQSADATVTVIHGIPGQDLGLAPELPVDVEVSGGCVLTGFTFGTVSARLPVPPGSYDIRVRLSDGACGGAVAVEALGVPFASGESATVVAHLSESGAPTASKFTNDLSPAPGLEGRIQAHHTAAAPAVDLRFIRPRVRETLNNVTNGLSGAVELGARTHRLDIAPAGGRAIFSQQVEVLEGQTILAYAVGSLSTGSFTLLVDVQQQAVPASVTVVHGITGEDLGLSAELPVDVSVAGVGCIATDFRFGDFAKGFSLPAGSYDIQISLSDGACGGAVAVSATGVPLAPGEDATVIAHLDASGAPTASKFTNDFSDVRRRGDRFVVHHTAAAPAVDLALSTFRGRKRLDLQGVVNGQSGGAEIRRGLYIFSVAPAGGAPIFRAFAPISGTGEVILAYAVGSVSTGTFQIIADSVHP